LEVEDLMELTSLLKRIVGDRFVLTDREKLENYILDETPIHIRPRPASNLILVKPSNTQEVSEILKIANKYRIPVYPRGGGSGLAGGAIPTRNGIILSLERMNRIEIDRENLMAVAEAGVTLEKLIKTAEEAELFFPLHPGDESAQIGGLISTNAGGTRAVKFGIMRNYVKGLEVVLPTGEVLRLGGRLQKNNAGYDLMHLIIGSEGTLAIITKAIIKLYSKFEATATLVIPFENRQDAINSVPKILQGGVMPLAIEYVERELMEKTAKHLGEIWQVKEGRCYLLVIVAEQSREEMLNQSLKIAEICKNYGAMEPLFAEPKEDQDRILRIRSNIYLTLKSEMIDTLDVTVPPASIGKLIEEVDRIAGKYDTRLPAYGHAGDGNLHIHIMDEGRDEEYYEKLRSEIYDTAVKLGGTITGEHGIGKVRVRSLMKYMDEKQLEIMRKIKEIFDPNNILNPEAVIP